MDTTTKQAIRKALNNAKIDNGDRVREAGYRMRKFYEQREAECTNALALLDKSREGEVRGAGKALTDEEIERIAEDLEDILCKDEGVVRSSSWLYREGAKDALCYARDRGYLAPSPQAVTVDGIMEVVDEELDEWLIDPDNGVTYNDGAVRNLISQFRTRLDQYLNNR